MEDKQPPQQSSSLNLNLQNQSTTLTNDVQLKKQTRPGSLNLTSNDSSNNLLSNASRNHDSSSLCTNNSSDCIATYDSDNCCPLSQGSSNSKIDAIRGSAARLDLQTSYIHEDVLGVISMSDEHDSITKNKNNLHSISNEHHFTIGPESEPMGGPPNMMYMSSANEHHNRHDPFMYDDHNLDDRVGDDEVDGSYDPHKQVIVGICAMEKKAQSKPMKEILRRLEDYFEFIKTLVFEESIILNKPIEEWPLCDCLISFHSKGFPLSKAIEYARLRKPFLVNDLDIQYDIQDRRKVYKILEEADIELPRYAVLDRDSANPEDRELVESDDHIEVANFVFNKPFVEKPISAEDHNICIYYPAHAGGGSQRLFRKIGCRSSVYSNESHVRKTGSYIYEEFMPTDGTDVKVYTAGPDYAHAEARKSPALDGKVERDMDGKEIRYPVILTNKEKLIARRVCLAFKQTVCGFDLLRANGHSYVCDVNGFSFVKSSMKYYEDCSKILGNMMLRALAPQLHIPWSIPFQLDDPPIVPTTFGRMMELRCVIAVIRHGDRTPKQKMKLEVKHPKFFELYHKYGNTKNGQAKLKKPKQLQEVLDIARYLLGELSYQPQPDEVVEPRVKLKQLKSVLEMYGHFSGINRKVQLKYQPHGRPRRSSSEDEVAREPSLVLILKWGGELTPAGRIQAEDLGRCFRRLYPASGDYSGPQGLGLLRLHSTFRHDLKIYASDEGRVQMTAGAFAKGFLALEGELTPILFQMVKSANTNGLLDNDCESSKCQKLVKERLHDIMQKNFDLTAEDLEILNPNDAPSIEAACKFIGNPHQACEKVHKLIKELNALIRSKRQDNCYTQEYHLYHGETWDLLQRRWAKLEKDFKFPRSKRFDISKIPDIYDCIKYDLQHNQHTLQFQHAHELYTYAKALADIVIPQEYGITAQEKLMISLGTCSPLLRKIQADLLRNADSNEDDTESVNRLDPKYSHGVSSPDRHVRTRLYFTSESHIHSLVTALQYGGLLDIKRDEQWQRSMEFLSAISELNYLSQIVIMLYEDPTKEPSSDDRFHVEIHFSSGVINRITQQNQVTEPQGPGFRPHLHNKSYSNASSISSAKDGETSQQDISSGHSRVSSINGNNRQQDGMIKEEPVDEERSTDGDSREHSKSSSICMTPKKCLSPQKLNSKPDQTTQGGDSSTIASIDNKSSPTHSANDDESDLNENNQTLTQANARRLAMKSQQRCLARSYSAIAPLSLEGLFKTENPDKTNSEIVEENTQTIGEVVTGCDKQNVITVTDKTDELQDSTTCQSSNAKITNVSSVPASAPAASSSSPDPQRSAIAIALKKAGQLLSPSTNSPATTATTTTASLSSSVVVTKEVRDSSTKKASSQTVVTTKITNDEDSNNKENVSLVTTSSSKPRESILKVDRNSSVEYEGGKLGEVGGGRGGTGEGGEREVEKQGLEEEKSTVQLPSTPKIPVKNNWKTYEQYLASEMSSTPHHSHYHHHYQRRRNFVNSNQLDQQLINLPPIYHTIHHVSFSPSTLSSLAHSSASMSTSPQQVVGIGGGGGASLTQRYLAHKQQAGSGKQFFTLSASMPIQYKPNQNPRACSVADVSQYCGGPSSLISTAVISGSSPELVAVCPYSPNIRPLETLHNELSLKQFIDFITRLTRNHRSSTNNNLAESNHHQQVDMNANINRSASSNRGYSSSSINGIGISASGGAGGGGASSGSSGGCSSTNSSQMQDSRVHGQGQHQSIGLAGTGGKTYVAIGSNSGSGKNNSSNNNTSNSNHHASGNNAPLGLSPGNSPSNSLIWSGPPSSFASSPGPSSPSAAFELWSKLELEESANESGSNNSNTSFSANNSSTTTATTTTTTATTNSAGYNNTSTGSALTSANQ